MKLANLIRGNDRGAISLRLLLSLALISLSASAGVLVSGGVASAGAGTVKVDGDDLSGNDNNPHRACAIVVDWVGFDNGAYTSTVTFSQQGGAGGGTLVSTLPPSGGNTPAATETVVISPATPDYTQTYSIDTTGLTLTKQGYHLRIDVVVDEVGGGNVFSKSKVIYAQACVAGVSVDKTNNANGDLAYSDSEQAPAAGSNVTFKAVITNPTATDAVIDVITDEYPGTAAFGVCAGLIGTTLASGASVDCIFTVNNYAPAAGGSVENTVRVTVHEATVAARTASASDTSEVTTAAAPSLSVTKVNDANGVGGYSAAETVTSVGASVPFKATITNNSAYQVTVSSITDSIDLAAGVGVTCLPAVTTIAANSSVDCLFTLTNYSPADGVTKNNTVTVNAYETANAANTGSATSGISSVTTAVPPIIPPPPTPLAADLAVKKTGPASVTPGGTATWTLTVTNKGPGNASGFSVTDTLPAGVTLSSLSGTNFTCTAATLVCTFTSVLLPTQTAVVTVVGDVSSAISGTSIANVVVVGPTDATPADNTDTLVSAIDRPAAPADLVLEKAGPAVAVAGEQITWTITVTNAGGQDATGFTVGDPLATGVSLVSGAGDEWFCTTNLPLACVFPGTLAPGETAALEVTGLVDAGYDATSITNTASVPLTNDPTPENNSDSVTVPVAVPIEGGEEEPATGSPSPSPLPDLPFVPEEEMPEALPFTGSSTDQLLGVGALLSLLGLMLIVTGRRRRTVG